MQNRSPIADRPAVVFVDESYRIQMRRGAGWPDRPILSARSRRQNLTVRSDGPTARAVQEKDVGQIVATAFGQTPPTQSAVVATHDQAVAAGGPARVFVRKIDGDQPRAGFDAGRQPKASAIGRAEHGAAAAGDPSVLLIRKINGEQIVRHPDIDWLPRQA